MTTRTGTIVGDDGTIKEREKAKEEERLGRIGVGAVAHGEMIGTTARGPSLKQRMTKEAKAKEKGKEKERMPGRTRAAGGKIGSSNSATTIGVSGVGRSSGSLIRAAKVTLAHGADKEVTRRISVLSSKSMRRDRLAAGRRAEMVMLA